MQPRDIILTLIGPVLTAWVAAIVVRRRVHREFPFFFAYLVLSVIFPMIRLAVSGTYTTFFIVFWATETIYAVFALLVMFEVFHEVFLPFYMLWRWFRFLFPGAALLIVLSSIHYIHYPLHISRPMEIVFAFFTAVNCMEALLFGLFFALVLLLGVPWRSYPFAIVEGFGIAALGALIAYGLRSEFGTKYNTFAKYAPPVAYGIGILVWLDSFLRAPDPEVVHAWREQVTPQQLLAHAREYRRVLKGILGRQDD
jgi:hypothetical protein